MKISDGFGYLQFTSHNPGPRHFTEQNLYRNKLYQRHHTSLLQSTAIAIVQDIFKFRASGVKFHAAKENSKRSCRPVCISCGEINLGLS